MPTRYLPLYFKADLFSYRLRNSLVRKGFLKVGVHLFYFEISVTRNK
jgi:hypothetical protein